METTYFLPHLSLPHLFSALKDKGYLCIAPMVRGANIVYGPLDDSAKLPWGYSDIQGPGQYELTKTNNDGRAFAWSNGPSSIKPFLFKQQETLWRVHKEENGRLSFQPETESAAQALIGVRPCDITAMMVQDKVFLDDDYVDVRYQSRRLSLFTVVVNCSYSSDSCFCVAAGYGPKAEQGFDVAMTELDNGFVAHAGSENGKDLLQGLNLAKASQIQIDQSADSILQAEKTQKREIPSPNSLRNGLLNEQYHARWDQIEDQCTACGTCTQVCPTCFCHKKIDFPSLDGSGAEHLREWDSCFSENHSYVYGKVLREDKRSRYRQWLSHKFVHWQNQYSVDSGCVGCGRCITWCPVGIDVTEELSELCNSELRITELSNDE